MGQLLNRPALRLGDILRRHGPAYGDRHPLSPEQSQVLGRLADCRTAALGGHLESCPGCGYARASYNSCRDRHCPTCQASKRAAWLEARLRRLLPVPYFHVVFTVPDLLYPLMLHNPRRLYHLLFQAASATLLSLSADRRRLGAQVGITALLHTWGQNLLFHPHLHCVVTGGGLSADGRRWVAGRRRLFLPIKVLGRLFRGKFLAGLRDAYQAGLLSLGGGAAELAGPETFRRWLDACYGRDWVVYAKPPFGGPEHVFRYLGRYSHRVAIANSRLLSLDDTHVTFAWKDYADEQRSKVMRLTIDEFIRRFLLHVLPKGFVRIRHYGLLAGVNVATKLERCRHLLGVTDKPQEGRPTRTWVERVVEGTGRDPRHCPRCQGPLERAVVPPTKRAAGAAPREELPGSRPVTADSS
jgi:hypothetical protein